MRLHGGIRRLCGGACVQAIEAAGAERGYGASDVKTVLT